MTQSGAPGPLVFLVAGEASGDALAARLMAALKAKTEARVRFAGVGGPAMAAEGLESLFPMAELSVMGLAEVLPRAPRLIRRLKETAHAARRLAPDAVVTVDSPGFSLRLARRLKGKGASIPLVHYVAPQVWAWRPGRAKAIARLLDHLVVLLPFEAAWFERHGLACTFAGHPVVESGAGSGEALRFCARHGIAPGQPVIAVLPGSRHNEVARLLPVFEATLSRLLPRHPGLVAAIPLAEAVAGAVERAASAWPVRAVFLRGDLEKFDAFAAATCALAKSGTGNLELALSGVPMAIAYKVSGPSALIARRLLRVRYVSLVNLLLAREAAPEFLQQDCTPEKLAHALDRLIADPAARAAQQEAFAGLKGLLAPPGPSPSARAAEAVLRVIAGRQGARQGSERDRPKALAEYAEQWTRNAERAPFSAVLSDPRRWKRPWTAEEFFATGEEEIARLWAFMAERRIAIPEGKFLDFGCGAGRASQALRRRFRSGVGVDIAEPMIALAKRHVADVEFVVNASDDLARFADRSFDFVYSHIVLQHVPPPYQRRYIAEFLRLLELGGLAVFQVPTRRFRARGVHAVLGWARAALRGLLPFLARLKAELRRAPQGLASEMHVLDRESIARLCAAAGGRIECCVATNSTDPRHAGRIEFEDYSAEEARLESGGRAGLLSAMFFVRKDGAG